MESPCNPMNVILRRKTSDIGEYSEQVKIVCFASKQSHARDLQHGRENDDRDRVHQRQVDKLKAPRRGQTICKVLFKRAYAQSTDRHWCHAPAHHNLLEQHRNRTLTIIFFFPSLFCSGPPAPCRVSAHMSVRVLRSVCAKR